MSDKKRSKEGKRGGNKKGKKDKTETLDPAVPQVAPKLKPMASLETGEGKKVSLKCEARIGNPVPNFKWYKDGKEFSGKNKLKDVKIKKKKGGKVSELQFRKPTDLHSGLYECEAQNDLGRDRTSGNLTVIKGKSALC
ncbi:hypothetical protein AGOR_G00015060 [Albula goreensis]|uniref:Ig-like domain-containing protein n=1 Tax=Albula goreensis TaxID=1534307 RepID=A0A8T3EAY6_9TELE|nr:hypothetical protein AGOR_G00015060 [Albula goreensis]